MQGDYYKENYDNSPDSPHRMDLQSYYKYEFERETEFVDCSPIRSHSINSDIRPNNSPLSESSDHTLSSTSSSADYNATSTNDYNLSSSTDNCGLRCSANLTNQQLKLPISNPLINSTMVTSTYFGGHHRIQNRIPLPGELEMTNSFDTDSLIRLRNLRERKRVRSVNDGFDRLRKHLPAQQEFKKDKRLSKVQTLKLAITYIRQLENILDSTGGKQII